MPAWSPLLSTTMSRTRPTGTRDSRHGRRETTEERRVLPCPADHLIERRLDVECSGHPAVVDGNPGDASRHDVGVGYVLLESISPAHLGPTPRGSRPSRCRGSVRRRRPQARRSPRSPGERNRDRRRLSLLRHTCMRARGLGHPSACSCRAALPRATQAKRRWTSSVGRQSDEPPGQPRRSTTTTWPTTTGSTPLTENGSSRATPSMRPRPRRHRRPADHSARSSPLGRDEGDVRPRPLRPPSHACREVREAFPSFQHLGCAIGRDQKTADLVARPHREGRPSPDNTESPKTSPSLRWSTIRRRRIDPRGHRGARTAERPGPRPVAGSWRRGAYDRDRTSRATSATIAAGRSANGGTERGTLPLLPVSRTFQPSVRLSPTERADKPYGLTDRDATRCTTSHSARGLAY